MKKLCFMLLSGAIFSSCIGTPGHAGICEQGFNECKVALIMSLQKHSWDSCYDCSHKCQHVEAACPFNFPPDPGFRDAAQKILAVCHVPCHY